MTTAQIAGFACWLIMFGGIAVIGIASHIIDLIVKRIKARRQYVRDLERSKRALEREIGRLQSESRFLKFELETKGGM